MYDSAVDRGDQLCTCHDDRLRDTAKGTACDGKPGNDAKADPCDDPLGGNLLCADHNRHYTDRRERIMVPGGDIDKTKTQLFSVLISISGTDPGDRAVIRDLRVHSAYHISSSSGAEEEVLRGVTMA